MTQAIEKLRRHREKAIKKGTTAAQYAADVGLSAQRIGRLLKTDKPATPTLAEAVQLHKVCKIKPALWLDG